MAKKKDKHTQLLDDYLRGNTALSRAYHATARAQPSSALDGRILAQAKRAVRASRWRIGSPFGAHWLLPGSAVAVLALSVGVALIMTRESGLLDAVEPKVATEATSAPTLQAELGDELAAAPAYEAEPRAAEAAQDRLSRMPSSAPPSITETQQKTRAPAAAPIKEAPAIGMTETRLAEEAPRRSRADRSMPAENQGVVASADAPVERFAAVRKEAGKMKATAEVLKVQASGRPGAYSFSVTVRSADQGCSQYADWWEVVSLDGKLLYRRVLLHSHVDEQPFTRSGGPVPVAPDTEVWVRAHMNPGGYGGTAMRGSVAKGFSAAALDPSFAAGLIAQAPLPEGCAY